MSTGNKIMCIQDQSIVKEKIYDYLSMKTITEFFLIINSMSHTELSFKPKKAKYTQSDSLMRDEQQNWLQCK